MPSAGGDGGGESWLSGRAHGDGSGRLGVCVCVCLGVRLEATVVQLLDISHAGPFIYRRRRRRRRCRRRHPLLYSGGYGCQQFWRQMGEEEDDRSPSIAGLRGMIAYRSHILWACALSALLR